jgi:hypothetical protein
MLTSPFSVPAKPVVPKPMTTPLWLPGQMRPTQSVEGVEALDFFFWPQMALAYWLDAISQGQKSFDFQGVTPFPLALVMDAACIKRIT